MKQSTFFVDYQNGSEMYKWYQVLVQDLDENVDENLAWQIRKTEDLKSNKGNLFFLRHTLNVIELNCKIVKIVPTLYFYPYFNPPPPFQVYPPFIAKSFVSPLPPINSILEGLNKGGGGSNYGTSFWWNH